MLKRKTTLGFIWVSVSFFLAQSLNFISLIILARLLFPEDFGTYALVTIIIFFITTLSEFGLGAALIQRKDIDEETINTAFTIITILGLSFAGLLLIFSPLIASFFNEPIIVTPLRVMTIAIILISLGVIPTNLLERNLDFKKRMFAEILPLLGQVSISITLALAGADIWSLVGGAITSFSFSTLLVWKFTALRPRLQFNPVIAKQLIKFGQHITYGVVLLYVAVNLDRFYLSYVADAATVGYYSLGLTIGNWVGNIALLTNRVMFPAFSRSQENPQLIRQVYLRVLRFVAMVSFPVTMGIFLIAPRMVLILYGEKWLSSVIFIRILVFYGLLRSLNALIGPVFAAAGKPSNSVQMIIARLLFLIPLMFLLNIKFNTVGIGLATIIAMAISTIYAYILTRNELMLSLLEVSRHIISPLVATIVMGIGVSIASIMLPMNIASLAFIVIWGVSLYIGSLFILFPRQILTEVKEIKGILFPTYA